MDNSPNQKDANNKSGDEKSDSRTKQIEPSHGGNGIQSVFSDNIFRFLASVAIVSWMIHEFVFDTHKIFLFTAIVFGLAEAFYVLAHKILKSWVIFWWLVYAVCLVAILKNEAQPEPKPHPHFTFSLYIGSVFDSDKVIELTNDFLLFTNDNEQYFDKGVLCLPIASDQSNILINFLVRNESSEKVDDAMVIFLPEQDLKCVPRFGWQPVNGYGFIVDSLSADLSNPIKTNKFQSWGISAPPMLPEIGCWLPPFEMTRPPTNQWKIMEISARANDPSRSPIEFLSMDVAFIPIPTNSIDSYKPFVGRIIRYDGKPDSVRFPQEWQVPKY